MRGNSIPTGLMVAPQVNGYAEEIAQRMPHDPEKSKALLKAAGYPDGFEITLDCPNNRYINDEAICQAIAAMWTKVGIKTKLTTMPRANFFRRSKSVTRVHTCLVGECRHLMRSTVCKR